MSNELSIGEKEARRLLVLARALGEIWVKEVPGKKHENRILEYHRTTSLHANTDEVPWCASFVNWVLNEANLKRTNSAAARSFLFIGEDRVGPPRVGDIVVLKRGKPGQGHVAFFIAERGDSLYLLGGNQANAVCIKAYPKSSLLRIINLSSLIEPTNAEEPETTESGKLMADYPGAWDTTAEDEPKYNAEGNAGVSKMETPGSCTLYQRMLQLFTGKKESK